MDWPTVILVVMVISLAAYGVFRLIQDASKARKSRKSAAIVRGWNVANGIDVDLVKDWQASDSSAAQDRQTSHSLGGRAEKRGFFHEWKRFGIRIYNPAASELLDSAQRCLDDAAILSSPNERFATAHLAALRAAAAVLALRRRPEGESHRRRRVRSAWEVLPEIAPELGDWALLFAAGAEKRARAEAGLAGAVSEREADQLMQDAYMFVGLVERLLLLERAVSVETAITPDLLEVSENQDTGAAVRHLSQGFDDLFRALGPPPPGMRQRQSVSDGGGGTAR